MKEISNGVAKGFSDAALMIRYLYMLLSKAAESAHRRRCRGGRSANRTFDGEITAIAAL